MRGLLDIFQVPYAEQYRIKGYGIADFYLPDLRLVVEVDGDWWHRQPENQRNDRRKDAAANALGLTMLRVPESALVAA